MILKCQFCGHLKIYDSHQQPQTLSLVEGFHENSYRLDCVGGVSIVLTFLF